MSDFFCTFVADFVRTQNERTHVCKKEMKIAIIGYGKMGHMIEEVALERGHKIVARIDAGDVFDLRDADVAIEFTTPATAKDNILRAWAQGVPVISGSTGWNVAFSNEIAKVHTTPLNGEATHASALPKNWKFSGTPNKVEVRDETGKVMLVWSSNYSVGVNITFELNKILAQMMSTQPQYTPSIKEIHHIHKLDKPSGTAKTLAKDIEDLRLKIDDLKIESIREGEVPGTHIVTWDSEEDTIVLTHIAKGRRGFALGAVLAAEEILNI